MAFDIERLTSDLGVVPGNVDRAVLMDPETLAENVATVAVVHSSSLDPNESVVLDGYCATNTLLGLQNTNWSTCDEADRTEAAIYALRILGALGLHPYGVEEQ